MPAQHFFSSRGLKLSYLDWGNADAPLLVLVHGGLEHARAWGIVAEALSEQWHVVAPDLRGHGDSDWSAGGAYGVDDFIPDLVALVDKLQIESFTLVGHSLGGNISIHYAALFPEKVTRLCVIEGLGYSPEARRKRDEKPRLEQLREWIDSVRQLEGRTPRRYASAEEAADRIMHRDQLVDRETALYIAKHGLREAADGSFLWKYDRNCTAWSSGDIATPEPRDFWRAIECKVLLIYGAESWASNPEDDGRAKHFSDVEVILVENAGHNVQHHQTSVFLEHLENFLAS